MAGGLAARLRRADRVAAAVQVKHPRAFSVIIGIRPEPVHEAGVGEGDAFGFGGHFLGTDGGGTPLRERQFDHSRAVAEELP